MGKKATIQFRILGGDAYWKLGSKDMLTSPTQGDLHIGQALDALNGQNAFDGARKVVAIGTASHGIKVSSKQEEILAGQRANTLLDQLRLKVPGVWVYALNLGRYMGNRDDNRQRLAVIVSVFDSDPEVDLEDALLGALHAKQMFGLNMDQYSKIASATLQVGPPPR